MLLLDCVILFVFIFIFIIWICIYLWKGREVSGILIVYFFLDSKVLMGILEIGNFMGFFRFIGFVGKFFNVKIDDCI